MRQLTHTAVAHQDDLKQVIKRYWSSAGRHGGRGERVVEDELGGTAAGRGVVGNVNDIHRQTMTIAC